MTVDSVGQSEAKQKRSELEEVVEVFVRVRVELLLDRGLNLKLTCHAVEFL